DLSLTEQLTILGVLLLTSKGAAAVTGGGFITLAATLATLGGKLPVEGLALLLGVDRFMSEARAITNLIGNGVAAVVVSKWENALDSERMTRVLNGETVEEADEPEAVADAALKPADLAKAA
ncbi:MAG TPA: cation:dicarboxylase symporter family transporter, partial [Azospira sp.]|nr:cation:dicarboxylase symporter family transporter [Azospira sp.]HJW04843.1 cation:dicarboxylase symporter family transporter [Azospira sp.]